MLSRQDIFTYVKEKYEVKPEYLWGKYPNYAVLRHKEGSKWFAVILDVPKSKIGLIGDKKIDIMDLKCDPLLIGSLRNEPGILPAYHMSKEHWITVVLSESFSNDDIYNLIDLSYALTTKGGN